jgi:hypothetical protein
MVDEDAMEETDDDFMERYDPIKSVGNEHRVSYSTAKRLSHHDLQCMQHGSTVVRWDSAGHTPAAVVMLRLENDGRTLSWTRPAWSSLRGGAGVLVGTAGGTSSAAAGATSSGSTSTSSTSSSSTAPGDCLYSGDADPRISPALACRYQLQQPYRIDDFDDGFVDLAVVKDFWMSPGPPVDPSATQALNSGSSSVPSAASRRQNFNASSASGITPLGSGGISSATSVAASSGGIQTSSCLTLLFGVGTTDNRTVEFVAPPRVVQIWQRGLSRLVSAWRAKWRRGGDVDFRVQWLQEQYLQLYFENGRCHGPTPAEAIRVGVVYFDDSVYRQTVAFAWRINECKTASLR